MKAKMKELAMLLAVALTVGCGGADLFDCNLHQDARDNPDITLDVDSVGCSEAKDWKSIHQRTRAASGLNPKVAIWPCKAGSENCVARGEPRDFSAFVDEYEQETGGRVGALTLPNGAIVISPSVSREQYRSLVLHEYFIHLMVGGLDAETEFGETTLTKEDFYVDTPTALNPQTGPEHDCIGDADLEKLCGMRECTRFESEPCAN